MFNKCSTLKPSTEFSFRTAGKCERYILHPPLRNPDIKKLWQADWAWGSKKLAHGQQGGRERGIVPPLWLCEAPQGEVRQRC